MASLPFRRPAAAFLWLLRWLRAHARIPLVADIAAHWLHERSTLRQGFVALGLGISIALLAGVVLGAMDRLLERLPGLLTLVPAAIGMRGATFGALGARLSTGMLTGQVERQPHESVRRSFLGQNIEATVVLSAVTAVLLAVVARGAAAALNIETIDVWALTVVSMVATIVSSAMVLAIVLALLRTAERRRWDMDAIGTPVISSTADITTMPALVVGALLADLGVITTVLGAVFVVAGLVAAGLGLRNEGERVRRVVRESLPILTYTAVLGVLAGTVMEARRESLISSQALLVAVPPFVYTCGAIGGILSARLSSQLHLGLLDPRPLPSRTAWLEGSLSLFFGLIGFALVGLLTAVVSVVLAYRSPGMAALVGITSIGGALAVVVLFFVGYYAATASYRFGLDPDNASIPLVTSAMDFFGILCLVAGILAIGG